MRQTWAVATPSYPCPCCGYLVFDEPPGSYDICSVCGWEDDLSQLRFPTTSGANRPLVECQRAFVAAERTRAVPQRPASTRGEAERDRDLQRDRDWRPLDLDVDEIEVATPGVDYGMTYPDDPTTLYYWRSSKADPASGEARP